MNKNLRKKLKNGSKIALTAFLTVVLAGCGVSDTVDVSKQKQYTNISFSWWGTDARNQYTLDAINSFENLHPTIKVNTKYGDWSGYEKRTDIEMAAATEADVMQINYAWINKYSSDEQRFYDLNELSDIIDITQFSDDILSYGMNDGRLEAIPIALNAMTMYYNKSVYDSYGLQLPETIEDLYTAAKVMSKDGVYPLAGPTKNIWFLCVSLEESNSGKNIFDKDNNIKFSTENLSNVISYAVDLVENNVIPDLSNYDKTKFDSGEYAGLIMWISDGATTFTTAEENGYEVVVGDYCGISEKNFNWYVKPATMYAISNNTEYPQESALLLDFLLNSKEMAEKQGIEKGIPVSQSALDVLESNDMLKGIQYDAYCRLEDDIDSVSQISPYFEDSDLIDVFYDAVSKVIYADYTCDEAAEELMTALKKAAGA